MPLALRSEERSQDRTTFLGAAFFRLPVVVSVRDDGAGFVYDEAELHSSVKAGILKSMKGRIESLGYLARA